MAVINVGRDTLFERAGWLSEVADPLTGGLPDLSLMDSILSSYYDFASLGTFDVDFSLNPYIYGPLSWSQKVGEKSYDATPVVSGANATISNTLNYIGDDISADYGNEYSPGKTSTIKVMQTIKETGNHDGTGSYDEFGFYTGGDYDFYDPSGTITVTNTINFTGLQGSGQTLVASNVVVDTNTTTIKKSGSGIDSFSSPTGSSNKFSDTSSFTYTEGGLTKADKTDDLKVVTTTKSTEESSQSYSETDSGASGSWSESDSGTDDIKFTYSDGAGYKLTLNANSSFSESYGDKYSFSGQAEAHEYSGKSFDSAKVSEFSYSDASKNTFKLVASFSDSADIDKNTGFDVNEKATAVITSISFVTAELSISTSGSINLADLTETDIEAMLADIPVDLSITAEISTLFDGISTTVKSLALLGNNTIKVLTSDGLEVYAGNGNDVVIGGNGDDTLHGGAGKDTLTGGKGHDTFVFDADLNAVTNFDAIKDFVTAAAAAASELKTPNDESKWLTADTIQLDGNFFTNTTFVKVAKVTAPTAPEIASGFNSAGIIYESSTGKLFYDADGGSGSGVRVHFATLNTKPTNLTADDFIVTDDTIAPVAPVVTGVTGANLVDGILYSKDNTPTITGTAEANSTVTLDFGEGVFGTTTAGANGAWSFEVISLFEPDITAFADGYYDAVSVTATDAALNESEATVGLPLVIDTVILDPVWTGATDAIISDGKLYTLVKAPALTGTAEAGATVKVYNVIANPSLAAGALMATVIADSITGEWSLQLPTLVNGTYQAKAVAVDAAGNISGEALGLELVITDSLPIDVTAPDAPVFTGVEGGNMVAGIIYSNDNTPTITGTAEAYSEITMFVDVNIDNLLDGGDLVMAITTADVNGNWSVTVASPLADGDYPAARAIATDAAGNFSVTGLGLPLVIDTVAQDPVWVGATDAIEINGELHTTNHAPALLGTAEAGATVHVYNALGVQGFPYGEPIGNAVADVNGDWSLQLQTLADGTYQAYAQIVDLAGNISIDVTGLPLVIETFVV